MNIYLLIAGILSYLLSIVHSVLGEYLIFRHKRVKGSLVPQKSDSEISKRHLGIIWATWHLVSIFGWCIGAILIKIAFVENDIDNHNLAFIIRGIMYAMIASSATVFLGTKGRHPGWIVLLAIAILLYIGS